MVCLVIARPVLPALVIQLGGLWENQPSEFGRCCATCLELLPGPVETDSISVQEHSACAQEHTAAIQERSDGIQAHFVFTQVDPVSM
jgi:hypothetical protein